MLLKLKKIFATDLLKVSFLNAIATLVRMLTGFISSKIVAVVIGPSVSPYLDNSITSAPS